MTFFYILLFLEGCPLYKIIQICNQTKFNLNFIHKLFYKIFLPVLLLTCLYTYTLKSLMKYNDLKDNLTLGYLILITSPQSIIHSFLSFIMISLHVSVP